MTPSLQAAIQGKSSIATRIISSMKERGAVISVLTLFPLGLKEAVSNIGGDNNLVQILFPNVEIGIRMVEQGNGNRLSRLTLTTAWLNENDGEIKSYDERFLGLGASFSETTIELRFRSAMDSVGATFPGRTLTRNLVGPLPLSLTYVCNNHHAE
jgi:hypothetical protein